jgi:hypothetical protein
MSDMKQKVSQCVTDHQGGEVDAVQGPCGLGGTPAWEVLAYLEDEEDYAVRYVVEAGGGGLRYLDGFQALYDWVTEHHKSDG